MVWIAETAVSQAELRQVAEETGIGTNSNFVAFAYFIAEQCAAIADRARACGEPDAGRKIRSSFAACWPDGSTAGRLDRRAL
jgi:hypothetical protein